MNAIRSFLLTTSIAAALVLGPPMAANSADDRIASQVEPTALSNKKRTRLGLYVSAKEAGGILEAHPDILLIDVRTRPELMFVGMPTTAAKNIPFLEFGSYGYDGKKKTYKLDPNPAFAGELERFLSSKGADKTTTLILMCRSGTRSSKAANELTKLGYGNVYSMVDGFEGDGDKNGARTLNGWKNAGLPWTFKLEQDRLYKEPK